jgi:hypothetical protein
MKPYSTPAAYIAAHVLKIYKSNPELDILEAVELYIAATFNSEPEPPELTDITATEYILSCILEPETSPPPSLTSLIIKYKPYKPAEPAQINYLRELLKARINRADKWSAATLEKLTSHAYLTNIPKSVFDYIRAYKDKYKGDPFYFYCSLYNIGKMYGIRAERNRRRGRAPKTK